MANNNKKVVVVIGSTGVGKSTICNILSGRPHDDCDLFPVSGDMESCTNRATSREVNWRGDPAFPFTLIDTPGLNDPVQGADSRNIVLMAEELRKAKHINVFLIVLNGTSPRLDQSVVAMLKLFENFFGKAFLKGNTMFEFTNWAQDRKSVLKRGANKDEKSWTGQLNKKLGKLIGTTTLVPAVFIDSLYDCKDDTEAAKFEEDMKKLKQHMWSFPAYPCEGIEAVKTELDEARQAIKRLEELKEEMDRAAKKDKEEMEKERKGLQDKLDELAKKAREAGCAIL